MVEQALFQVAGEFDRNSNKTVPETNFILLQLHLLLELGHCIQDRAVVSPKVDDIEACRLVTHVAVLS